MQYKACIFDMDGTVLNTLHTIAYYGNQALEAHGLPRIEDAEYCYLVGDGAKVLISRMLRFVHADPSLHTKVYEYYQAHYDADVMHLTTVYDGISELLASLRAAGIRCAVLTNKPDSTAQLVRSALFLPEDFALCIGQREGLPLKPAPDGALDIAKKLGLSPRECLYLGDTSVDMDTGEAAGMDTVGVLWGFRTREELTAHRATYLASHPAEVLKIIAKSQKDLTS